MINLLDKLTLVVPTYNRQRYALRNMRYWSGRGVTVHVMDGSSVPIAPSQLTGLTQNVHYHHLATSLHDRLRVAIGLVSTEYASMLCDDEFFIPSGLEACIRELERQEDLVSCNGRCVEFNALFGVVSGAIAYSGLENYAILHEDALARMNAHVSPYVPSTIYSVVRTPVWRKSMLTFVQKSFSLDSFEELAFELSVCYHGKSKVIPVLSWLRSNEVPPVRLTAMKHEVKVSITRWLHDPAFTLERSEFLTIFGSILSNNQEEAVMVSRYFNQALHVFEKYITSNESVFLKLVYRISPFVNKRLKLLLRPLLQSILRQNSSESVPILDVVKKLSDVGVRVNYGEIHQIKSIIEEFHVIRPALS